MKKVISFLVLLHIYFSCASQNSYTNCGVGPTTLTASAMGLTSVTYTLYPGPTVNNTGSFVVTPSTSTSYTITMSGLNAAQAIEIHSTVHQVNVYSQPSVAPVVQQKNCTTLVNQVSLNLTFAPTTPNSYSISWSPSVFPFPTTNATPFGGNLTPGTYNFTITAQGGCSLTNNITILPAPAWPSFSLSPSNSSFNPTITINCFNPTVIVTPSQPSYSYTWTNGFVVNYGPTQSLTPGNLTTWTVTGAHPVSGCTYSQTFTGIMDISAPQTSVSPVSQTINCNLNSIITVTGAATPSNVTNTFYSPVGGILTLNSPTATYVPGIPGTYTHCATYNVTGCSTCKQFTVTANQGFPTFSLVSVQNFSLGCGTKSIETISIVNASATNSNQVPNGGPVTFSLLSPTSSTIVNVPGTYTAVVKDNASFCETRIPFTISQNTVGPNLAVNVPAQILDCYTPSVQLVASSTNPLSIFAWTYPGTPGTSAGPTFTVNSIPASPTSSFVANFTMTATDPNSTCKTVTVIPIMQNLYPPKAVIAPSFLALSCQTPTVLLSNQSVSQIPPVFSSSQPVIGLQWIGPSPQASVQVSTTYTATVPGVYTLVAQDSNNGCTTLTTTTVNDKRFYPLVNNPVGPPPFDLCNATTVTLTPIITSPQTNLTYSWNTPASATVSGANSLFLVTNTQGTYTINVKDQVSGCTTSATLLVVYCVGLDERSDLHTKKMYPNPVKDRLYFDGDLTNASVVIYDLNGMLIRSESRMENNQIDLSELRAGFYFIEVLQKDHRKRMKIQKE